ncbi:MAG: hypothetical protein JOY91_14385 [Sinobacteraceae bacterium]|nr:hypothetical protein [Nevskiaceae bacterium]
MRWTLSLPCAVILLSAATRAEAADFNFAALRTLIETRHIQSVEELLPALPAPLRYRYTLVFASRSLQQASYRDPRVILYGTDARLVLTFNGQPTQRGYEVIEAVEFGPDKRFRLREIRFPSAGSAGEVTFSEPNPATCQACHGQPARPIWDSWPLWPGVYGQRYDTSLPASERAGLESFLAAQASHPRYRHLLDVQRLAAPQTFHASSSTRYSGAQQESPNAEFSSLLEGLVAASLVREMQEQPRFAQVQYALLGAAGGDCGSVSDFLPSAARAAVKEGLRHLSRTSEVANRWAATLKQQRLRETDELGRAGTAPTQGVRPPDPANALIPLRLLAEAGLGMRTDNWTLALEKGTYDLTAAPGAGSTLRDALLSEISAGDPSLAALSSNATSVDGDRYCRYLRRRSEAELSSPVVAAVDWSLSEPEPRAPPSGTSASRLPATELLRVCAACHDSAGAPRIPFLEERALKQALLSGTTRHGRLLEEVLFRLSADAGYRRMPLGIAVSDADRSELQQYFVALGAHAP